MTAPTEYPARAEEFGTRARVLPLFRCTSALGTQIVAALRLRFRLRKSVRRAQRRSEQVYVAIVPRPPASWRHRLKQAEVAPLPYFVKELRRKILLAKQTKIFAPLTTMFR